MRVLVVEDEPRMADILRRGLTEAGYAVDVATTGTDGWWRASEHDYDAIVLDVRLPDVDGFTVLQRLRASERWAPVLMLTAHDSVPDRVRGLDAGADDYLTKPFAFSELSARLRALVRRSPAARPSSLRHGDLVLDPAARTVHRAGVAIPLTAKQFALLECLLHHPGRALSRTELIEHVWDGDFDADSNVVDVYIAHLRHRIDRPFGRESIETVRGVGYRLRESPPVDDEPDGPATADATTPGGASAR